MEDGSNNTVLCKTCLEDKRATLYCSDRCAAKNLSKHREAKHDTRSPIEDVTPLITPLSEVVEKTMKEGNPGLKYSTL